MGRPTLPDCVPLAVRGALGAAVVAALCEVGEPPTCVGCERLAACRVPGWFDPGRGGRQGLRPFVVGEVLRQQDPSSGGRALVVRTVWLGPVPSLLVVDALREVAVRLGRTAEDGWTLDGVRVSGGDQAVEVVVRGRAVREWPDSASLGALVRLPTTPVQGARVELVTPVQLDHRSTRPTAATLLAALVRRVRGVQRYLGVPAAPRWTLADGLVPVAEELEWVPGARRSRHQGQRVDLSGWTGWLELGPEAGQVVDLLAVGEVLQVGRHTSEGLGRLRVEWS